MRKTVTMMVLFCVEDERYRQEQLKENGKFRYTCADAEVVPGYKLSVLAEEFGEVAAIVNQQLIQVAAVAVAWAESL